MPYLKCNYCGAILEVSNIPDACPGCGCEASSAFPIEFRDSNQSLTNSVESLFDLGGKEEAFYLSLRGKPARLRDRSEPRASKASIELEVSEDDIIDEQDIKYEKKKESKSKGQSSISSEKYQSSKTGRALFAPALHQIKQDKHQEFHRTEGPLLDWTTNILNEQDIEVVSNVEETQADLANNSAGSKHQPIKNNNDSPARNNRKLSGRVALPINEPSPPVIPPKIPETVSEVPISDGPPKFSISEQVLVPPTEQVNAKNEPKKSNLKLTIVSLLVTLLGGGAFFYFFIYEKNVATSELPPSISINEQLPILDSGIRDQGMVITSADSAIPDMITPDRAVTVQKRKVIPRGKAPTVPKIERPQETHALNEEVSETSQEQSQALYQEGLQSLMRGDANQAIQFFHQALSKNPRASLCYRGLGLAYEKIGSKAMAKAAFSRYLILRPSAGDAEAIRQRIETLNNP